jgi:hypothetical protein
VSDTPHETVTVRINKSVYECRLPHFGDYPKPQGTDFNEFAEYEKEKIIPRINSHASAICRPPKGWRDGRKRQIPIDPDLSSFMIGASATLI